jgi:hypothetical protein
VVKFEQMMRRATIDRLSFNLRASGLRGRRLWHDWRSGPARLKRLAKTDALETDWPIIAGQSTTPLWTMAAPQEWQLTAGKVQNLRQAVQSLHGLHLPAGETFSFWRHVERPTRRHGYVAGRELREGCLVASIGGGLCQLSNAVYAAAIAAGCEIIERHRHSRIIPGSLAEIGLDATIFWNYVDLRFKPAQEMIIDARLTADNLVLRLRQAAQVTSIGEVSAASPSPGKARSTTSENPGDCLTCGEISCIYAIRPSEAAGRRAWLLDEVWPEFDRLQVDERQPSDDLHLPLDGKAWRRPGYAWTFGDHDRVMTYPIQTLWQARRLRRVSTQGAARQLALIERDQSLAKAYHRTLNYDVDQLVISLNLLPHLWRLGSLGGRRYAVLMTRSPLSSLQKALDAAGALHPQSPTLRDFRAPDWLIAAEEAALASAETLYTPHHQVAVELRQGHPAHIREIDWVMAQRPAPPATGGRPADDRPTVLFAGSSLGRKGAYEMRQAMRHLPIAIRILGRATEGPDFWAGMLIAPAAAGSDPLEGVACVVLPAFVEHQPRILLRALARGIPVVCSPACGISARPGVRLVPACDPIALASAITEALGGAETDRWRQTAE